MNYPDLTAEFLEQSTQYAYGAYPDIPLHDRVLMNLIYNNDWSRARCLLEANPEAYADENSWLILDTAVGMCLNKVADRSGRIFEREVEMNPKHTYFPTPDAVAFIAYLLENGADPHLPVNFDQLKNLDDTETDSSQQTGFQFDCSAVRALLQRFW